VHHEILSESPDPEIIPTSNFSVQKAVLLQLPWLFRIKNVRLAGKNPCVLKNKFPST